MQELSDSSSEEGSVDHATPVQAVDAPAASTKKPRSSAHVSSGAARTSSSGKKRKHHVTPVTVSKYSSYDLFGTDSEDEEAAHGNNLEYNLHSYFIKKCLKAFTRQIDRSKLGGHYIVLKIYNSSETDLWKEPPQPDFFIKNRTNSDTEAFYHLIKFIQAAKRQFRRCTIITMMKEDHSLINEYLFKDQREVNVPIKKPRKHVPVSAEPVSKKNKADVSSVHSASSAGTSKRTSASDVFGFDSDDGRIATTQPGKKPAAICSYFTKRLPHGLSRQIDMEKSGSHYIDLKIYNCDDIRTVQPMNRWRHAIITIKNKTGTESEAWTHLTNFIAATRKEFKGCQPELISGYGYSSLNH